MIGALSIEPVLAIYSFTIVIYTSITPQLLLEKVCLQKYNNSICNDLKNHESALLYTQKGASSWMMILFVLEMFTSFFGVLIWGPLTDIIGRKKYFLYIGAAVAVQNIVLSFSAHFPSSNPSYILIASFTSGSYGNVQGVISACYSYIADITVGNVDSRTKRMAVLEACIFLSACVSGLVSGQLVSRLGFTVVFLLNSGLGLVLLGYVLLLYKCKKYRLSYEPIKEDDERKASLSNEDSNTDDGEINHKKLDETSEKIDEVSSFNRSMKLSHLNPIFLYRQTYTTLKENRYRSRLILLLTIYLCGILAFGSDLYIVPIYLKNEPFHFTAVWLGYYIAVANLINGIGVALSGYISHVFKVSDDSILTLGFISQILVYMLTGLARTKLAVFLFRLSGLFGFVISTTLRSMVSKLVTPKQYGSAMACVVTADVAGFLLTNLAGLGIYKATLTVHTGIVFFVIASVSSIGLFLMIYIVCVSRRSQTSEGE